MCVEQVESSSSETSYTTLADVLKQMQQNIVRGLQMATHGSAAAASFGADDDEAGDLPAHDRMLEDWAALLNLSEPFAIVLDDPLGSCVSDVNATVLRPLCDSLMPPTFVRAGCSYIGPPPGRANQRDGPFSYPSRCVFTSIV